MPIEPDVGFAFLDDRRKTNYSLQIHWSSFTSGDDRSEGLGVELENLVLVQNMAGGTFGYKFSPTMEALLVGVAAMATVKSPSL